MRIFEQRSIHGEFIDGLGAFTKTVRVGNGPDPNTRIGPLIRSLQRLAMSGSASGVRGPVRPR
ncbi:aldehyde dehydrogenase family protein [Streptomyces griseoluteus]|uniref:aldehyde dehydrogenase family protein n=1 Tax=Streptomyces griseoluteus TaxID=29306 RepID=UPI00381FF002